MSTHTKFNPEGVKGRAAQPPHNFYKIMTQILWIITLNVKDVNTQIELPQWTWQGVRAARCPQVRVERRAKSAYKNIVLDRWKCDCCNNYGLTAKQLRDMIDDHLVTPPDLVEVTVAKAESEPWNPSPIGDDGIEPFDWD